MYTYKSINRLIISLLASLVLVSCGGGDDSAGSTAPPSATSRASLISQANIYAGASELSASNATLAVGTLMSAEEVFGNILHPFIKNFVLDKTKISDLYYSSCAAGGTETLGSYASYDFNGCQLTGGYISSDVANGMLRIYWENNANNDVTVTVELHRVEFLGNDGSYKRLNGVISISANETNRIINNIHYDVAVESSLYGDFALINFDATPTYGYRDKIDALLGNASGKLATPSTGRLSVNSGEHKHFSVLEDDKGNQLFIERTSTTNTVNIRYKPLDPSSSSYFNRVSRIDLSGVIRELIQPTSTEVDIQLTDSQFTIKLVGDSTIGSLETDLLSRFYNANYSLIRADIANVEYVHLIDAYNSEVIDNVNISYEYANGGLLEIQSNESQYEAIRLRFNLDIVSVDSTNSFDYELLVEFLLDSDNDNRPNYSDLDDDNDGVFDRRDAFRLDPSESADLDGDGVGDNTDLDRDGDGLDNGLDQFPEHQYCDSEGQAVDGQCIHALYNLQLLGVNKAKQVLVSASGTVDEQLLLYDPEQNKITGRLALAPLFVTSLQYVPERDEVLVKSGNTVRLFDAQNLDQINYSFDIPEDHKSWSYMIDGDVFISYTEDYHHIAFDLDGNILASYARPDLGYYSAHLIPYGAQDFCAFGYYFDPISEVFIERGFYTDSIYYTGPATCGYSPTRPIFSAENRYVRISPYTVLERGGTVYDPEGGVGTFTSYGWIHSYNNEVKKFSLDNELIETVSLFDLAGIADPLELLDGRLIWHKFIYNDFSPLRIEYANKTKRIIVLDLRVQ